MDAVSALAARLIVNNDKYHNICQKEQAPTLFRLLSPPKSTWLTLAIALRHMENRVRWLQLTWLTLAIAICHMKNRVCWLQLTWLKLAIALRHMENRVRWLQLS